MNSKIQNWEKEINQVTDMFNGSFSSLSPEILNRKPNPQVWSIAQIILHIIKTNETYYPVIKDIRSGNHSLPVIAKFSPVTNFFGNFILKSVGPDRKRKMKTFPIWEPSDSNIEPDIVQKFVGHQSELTDFIKGCADLIVKETVISSPANKIIVYRLDIAFDIIISHEKRHYNQALEVLELIR